MICALILHSVILNLDDDNFDEDDTEVIIYIRLMDWCNRYKQRKARKKEIRKELMPVACHPTECWDWCMSDDDKKEIEPFIIDEK